MSSCGVIGDETVHTALELGKAYLPPSPDPLLYSSVSRPYRPLPPIAPDAIRDPENTVNTLQEGLPGVEAGSSGSEDGELPS